MTPTGSHFHVFTSPVFSAQNILQNILSVTPSLGVVLGGLWMVLPVITCHICDAVKWQLRADAMWLCGALTERGQSCLTSGL